MVNNDLTGLLNLAYEIEGLLMLHINRGDEASSEMKSLLISKADRLLAGLKACDSMTDSAPEGPADHVEPTVAAPAVNPANCQEVAAEAAAEMIEDKTVEDGAAIAANALNEELEDAEPQPTVNDTLATDGQLTLDEKLARERATDISKAFTLNDRFRFRRELFRNSDEEFKETLEVIGSMSSMEEAEDYFFNDLCWDASNSVVKEFMAVVAKHF
ncbi:MAG: hypothetical protein NC411_10095 [Bacteroides sp.]|nr:hypothetical protein [Bacteroides sp.]